MPLPKSDIKLRSTTPFKLKDRKDRNWRAFNLLTQFGFLPESIIISKLQGMNNTIVLSAVLTKEEKEREDKLKESIKVKKPKK